MQYFEHDLATYLRGMRELPTHLLVNRVPAYEGETFFTLQNVVNNVVPYRIHGREQLVRSLLQLGYHLVDSWYEDHDINIPFHPERRVTRFYGFYFCVDKTWKAGWRKHAVATSEKLQVLLSGK
jgi:putative methyltransferase (TIGR04325 family)